MLPHLTRCQVRQRLVMWFVFSPKLLCGSSIYKTISKLRTPTVQKLRCHKRQLLMSEVRVAVIVERYEMVDYYYLGLWLRIFFNKRSPIKSKWTNNKVSVEYLKRCCSWRRVSQRFPQESVKCKDVSNRMNNIFYLHLFNHGKTTTKNKLADSLKRPPRVKIRNDTQ